MKIYSLSVFCVLLCLFNLAIRINANLKKNVKAGFNGYYFLQKIYRGNDPLLIIKNSQQTMTLKYFTLNQNLLAYSTDHKKSKTFEGKKKIKNKNYTNIKFNFNIFNFNIFNFNLFFNIFFLPNSSLFIFAITPSSEL